MIVYSIYKATNKINNKVYIGFTNDFPQRMREHKYASTRRKSKFYTAICKYGWANFDWEIIYQSLDKDHCSGVMEPIFIKEANSCGKNSDGYNLTVGGEAGAGAYNSKNWIVTTPEGIEIEVNNLHQFCKKNNISSSVLGDVAKNKRTHHKQWICRYEHQEKPIPEEIIYTHTCTDIHGNVFNTDNLKKFCEGRELCPSGMGNVMRGKANSYKGWKCKQYGQEEVQYKYKTTPKFRIVDSESNIYYVIYLKEFCKERDLSYHHMSRISRGKIVDSAWKIEKL